VFCGPGIGVPPTFLKSVRKILKNYKMYIMTVVFYDCVPQKPFKMLSVPSFEKG
jgi:hypothetical protein